LRLILCAGVAPHTHIQRNLKDKMKKLFALLSLASSLFVFTGCSSYITPGSKADLQSFAPPNIQENFAVKPSLPFPAGIAAVHIQAPDYTNYHLRHHGGQYGSGNYTVIMTREVEDQAQFDRVATLPQVAGIATLNRLLIPERLDNDRQIREAVSRLQADLVFVYTFETAFYDRNVAKPLTYVTLGLSPTKKVTAVTTVSALLLDTRTGYIYSAYEATERSELTSSSWSSRETADEARRGTEKRAFNKLIDDVVTSWPRLLERFDKKPQLAAAVENTSDTPR